MVFNNYVINMKRSNISITAFFNTVSSLPASSTGFTRVTKMGTGGEKRVGEGGGRGDLARKKVIANNYYRKRGVNFHTKQINSSSTYNNNYYYGESKQVGNFK